MGVLSADPTPHIPEIGYIVCRFNAHSWEGARLTPDKYNYEVRARMMEHLRPLHIEDVNEKLIHDIVLKETGEDYKIIEIICDEEHCGEDAGWKKMHFMGSPVGDKFMSTYLDIKLIDPVGFYESGRTGLVGVPLPESKAAEDAFLTDEYVIPSKYRK